MNDSEGHKVTCGITPHGDIVGHFWLVRNGVEKLVELKFEFFCFNTFDVPQLFWQRVYNRGPNTVIAFS